MEFNKTDEAGRRYGDITMPSGVTFRTYEDDPFIARQVKQTPDEEDWFEPVYRQWERGGMRNDDAVPVRKRTRTVYSGERGRSTQVEDWPWIYADYVGPKPDRNAYIAMGIESDWFGPNPYPTFNKD